MPERGQFGKSARSRLHFVLRSASSTFLPISRNEGARSVTGPFLGALGASGFIVGSFTGFGEFLGYALRLVSGRLADRVVSTDPLRSVDI